MKGKEQLIFAGRMILLVINLRSINGDFVLFSITINEINEIIAILIRLTIICIGILVLS
jgi:hypothetical protein